MPNLEEQLYEQLKTVYDPELPVNIVDLGLIYAITPLEAGKIRITMTLTNPMCPAAEQLPWQVQKAALLVPEVTDCEIVLTFDPPWDKNRISEAAKLLLNL